MENQNLKKREFPQQWVNYVLLVYIFKIVEVTKTKTQTKFPFLRKSRYIF